MRYILDLLILLTIFPCLKGGRSYVIESKSWDFRGHEIAYEVAHRCEDTSQVHFDNDDYIIPSKDPILLLNGFGVGSFHQHRLIPNLFNDDDKNDGVDQRKNVDRIIYGVDYLGQGKSWPRDCDDGRSENEKGLRYSAEIWVDQIISFLEEIVLGGPQEEQQSRPHKVHLVGNSVGGHLAVHIAHRRPDLIASISLLNPTPVWGLNLPGWSGHLPAPILPKVIGRYLFDQIRDLTTIEKYLQAAYARSEAFDEELMYQIRGCTLGNGGHAAFASILWSPPLKVSDDHVGNFQECLSRLHCDVLLIFGKDDPWCTPAFAKKMLQALEKEDDGQRSTVGGNPNKRVHRYVEVEHCGHCPNHEAPQAVGKVVMAWIGAKDRTKDHLTLLEPNGERFIEPWGEIIARERQESDITLNWIDWLATTFV